MKNLSLALKLFLASAVTLLLFFAGCFAILYQAQSQLAVREMDKLLGSQLLSLSVLVSSKPGNHFDFEISPFLLSHYTDQESPGFFRFVDASTHTVLRESTGSPQLNCTEPETLGRSVRASDGKQYRLKQMIFHPEIDDEVKNLPLFERGTICLLAGVDEAPYASMVRRTLISAVPLLLSLVAVLMGIVLLLIRSLTLDLSQLTKALETADFSATHEFPPLPSSRTREVAAVAEKLAILHEQAASVYKEMWLFMGRAAHQLKTPVTAIQATLEVLLRRERSQEELRQGLTEVQSAVNHLAILSKQLIASSRFSYQPPSETENIELRAFFENLFKLFFSQAQKRNILLKIEPSENCHLMASSVLLSELFGNLIENAILYTRAGESRVVNVRWIKNSNNIEIFVRDQGAGFSPQVRETLFQPFVRGDERTVAGSGLGLSIAKKIANLLHGDIELLKSSPSGSELKVSFTQKVL